MNAIQISTHEGTMRVISPYNRDFVDAARRLSGKFAAGAWVFDARNDAIVREALIAAYGTDGTAPADTVTVRLTWTDDFARYGEPIVFAGRTVARSFGRDSGAKLGDDVVLVSGSFTSGGSVKNWKTCAKAGTTVILRDIPRAYAESAIAENNNTPHVEIVSEPSEQKPDRAALIAERNRIMALLPRLDEIDALLAKL